MKIIITGMNGTVAPVLTDHLARRGNSIVAWNRAEVPPDDHIAGERFIRSVAPDALCHLATGSAEWAESLARILAGSRTRFLYTGSVSVFSTSQQGPFGITAEPRPTDDYGRYKLECERRILAVNSDAIVARIGWQIGEGAGSNNMVDYLVRANATSGGIDASEKWLPACSCLPDTAAALCGLLDAENARGIYHLDGNPGLSFFEIATRLNERHGGAWNVRPKVEPDWDQRLIDERKRVASITTRL